MKKVSTFLAGAVSVALVAMLLPASVFANCPNLGQVVVQQCFGGQTDLPVDGLGNPGPPLFGTMWVQGLANPAALAGTDSGLLTGDQADGNWIVDFGIDPTVRCIGIDWNDARVDGCPNFGAPMWVVVSDSLNNAMVASVAGTSDGGSPPIGSFDFGLISNGVPGVFGPGTRLGRAVLVNTAATGPSSVTLGVAALNIPEYFDTARPLPGVQLRGTSGGLPTVQSGSGSHSIAVDKDSRLCWDIVDTGFTAELGCVRVGGLTPSQNVQNAKVDLGKGKLNFSWDVSAQFDVLGFNIIQKNATKGTERTVNGSLIPINGMNDALAASYKFSAGRSELQATRGGFEIEMVRTNGETSRTPAPLK